MIVSRDAHSKELSEFIPFRPNEEDDCGVHGAILFSLD